MIFISNKECQFQYFLLLKPQAKISARHIRPTYKKMIEQLAAEEIHRNISTQRTSVDITEMKLYEQILQTYNVGI